MKQKVITHYKYFMFHKNLISLKTKLPVLSRSHYITEFSIKSPLEAELFLLILWLLPLVTFLWHSCNKKNYNFSFIFFFFNLFILAMSCVLWDINSPTRDQTQAPAVKVWSPNHWTMREYPAHYFNSTLFNLIGMGYSKRSAPQFSTNYKTYESPKPYFK